MREPHVPTEEQQRVAHEMGIMAGWTQLEIMDFMDAEFRKALSIQDQEKRLEAVHHLWWLNGNALMYAHSAGLFAKAMKKKEAATDE